jgi:hypothetical protein
VESSRRGFLAGACACAACLSPLAVTSTAGAKVLPTKLEPLVGPGYIPEDQDERGMWQSLEEVEEAIRTSPQRLDAPKFHEYTRGVVERLVQRPVPDLRIYLIRDASFNASMYPSGMMIVHTGLIARMRNEAQFAAVLGHEAGHYFRKHSIQVYRNLRRKASAGAFLSIIGGLAGSAVSMALMMSVLQFSRTQEAEADAYGLVLMSHAGYSLDAPGQVWKQVIEERKASALQGDRKYKDRSASVFSTHPATDDRMVDLIDTAAQLDKTAAVPGADHREEWLAMVGPHLPQLLEEQVKLNDPGANLYLVEYLAQDGWTGLLRYNEGEIYRMRNAAGDDVKAGEAYATAITLPDAPSEAWRGHGYALLKAGKTAEGRDALNKYLELNPGAKDAGMIRFTLAQ